MSTRIDGRVLKDRLLMPEFAYDLMEILFRLTGPLCIISTANSP